MIHTAEKPLDCQKSNYTLKGVKYILKINFNLFPDMAWLIV